MQIDQIFHRKAVFLPLLFLIGGLGILRWRSERARDYYQFWVVGRAIRSMELTNIYSPEDRQRIGQHFLDQALAHKASASHLQAASYRRVINPAGTPFLYAVFFLASSGDYDFDYTAFRIISLIVYLLSIVILGDLLRIPRLLTIFLLVLLTEYFTPFRLDAMEGNVNALQVGIIALILWLRSRKGGAWVEVASGVVTGLLIMFKPNLAPVGILLLGGTLLLKSVRPTLVLAGAMALGAAIGFGLPLVLFGKVCNWEQWRAAFPQLVLLPRYLNRSFPALIFHAQSLSPFFVLGVLLMTVPFLLGALRGGSSGKNGQGGQDQKQALDSYFNPDHLWMSLGVCTALLASTLVHYHYFLLLVPGLLALFRSWGGIRGFSPLRELRWMSLGLIVFLLMASRVSLTGDGNDLFDSDWRLAYIGTLLLYFSGLYHLRRVRRIDSTRAKG